MVVIYFNPHKKCYYAKKIKSAFWNNKYQIGYENQYNHKIVCMFFITDKGKLISCDSSSDYFKTKYSKKKILINKIIKWLERRV